LGQPGSAEFEKRSTVFFEIPSTVAVSSTPNPPKNLPRSAVGAQEIRKERGSIEPFFVAGDPGYRSWINAMGFGKDRIGFGAVKNRPGNPAQDNLRVP
jgi:hypothetical protein